jgi:hypothetical protein
MPALPELQRQFAAGLRGETVDAGAWIEADGLPPSARLGVYANNSRAFFGQALELTYPVLRRRVGDDYFAQLALHYRAQHPSPSGDLHEVGRAFAAFLAGHLADSPYAWLADLARLEWAVADAATCGEDPPAGLAALAGLAPAALAATRLKPVTSLRTVASAYPVFSVWRANQADQPGDAVDADAGAESVLLRAADGACVLHRVPPTTLHFIEALAGGAALAEAIDSAGLPVDSLPGTLGMLFAEGFIADVLPPDGDG